METTAALDPIARKNAKAFVDGWMMAEFDSKRRRGKTGLEKVPADIYVDVYQRGEVFASMVSQDIGLSAEEKDAALCKAAHGFLTRWLETVDQERYLCVGTVCLMQHWFDVEKTGNNFAGAIGKCRGYINGTQKPAIKEDLQVLFDALLESLPAEDEGGEDGDE